MQIISGASETVLTILKRYQHADCAGRMMKYCVQTPVDEGILLFNLLTRELLLLSEEEFSRYTEIAYLKEHWFVVPEDANDKEYADLVKWVLSARRKKDGGITSYTIFPTTDCNARCFYCFELGRSRIPMSQQTAEKVVQYIINNCKGKKVKIGWFGGEPLYNQPAIDTICDGLRREGIEYTSTMVSNGYLFDEATVKKAVESWNLKRVQITLDGTEEVYNRIKAYIYREGNPYQTVLANMERLLDASVAIHVRLNMDLYNAQNLLELADVLTKRFGGRKNIGVYAHHLFKGDQPSAELYTDEEWQTREDAMCRIEQKLAEGGLASRGGISKRFRLSHCMADNGSAVTIMPDGNIGLCEHFTETEFIGHIDRDGLDSDVVAAWRERAPEIPECADCFYYPDCAMLKKCPNEGVCFLQLRQGRLRNVRRQMLCEYDKWKKQASDPVEEDDTVC